MNRPSPDNMDLDIGHRERETTTSDRPFVDHHEKSCHWSVSLYAFCFFFSYFVSHSPPHMFICSFVMVCRCVYLFFFCAFLLCRMDRRFHSSTWNSGNDDPCNIAIYMCVETESCFPLGVLGVCETTTIAIAAYEWYNYSVIVSVFPLLLFFYSIIFLWFAAFAVFFLLR